MLVNWKAINNNNGIAQEASRGDESEILVLLERPRPPLLCIARRLRSQAKRVWLVVGPRKTDGKSKFTWFGTGQGTARQNETLGL
jgi:hypothetical protein